MKRKIIVMILLVVIMVVGCGRAEDRNTTKKSETKEKVQVDKVSKNDIEFVPQEEDNETEANVTDATMVDTVPEEPEKSSDTKKMETKKPQVTTPVVSQPIVTPEPAVKDCQHWYQPVEEEEYTSIHEMRWACNGCGYALYDILGDGTAVNFADMYSHPPCETDRYDEPCTGGGFHSESYYSGRCYHCHTEIIMRSCTYFHVMAERCLKNPSNFGEYEKVEDGCAYIKSCSCGENLLVSDGLTGMGLMVKKQVCSYCGDTKTYPQ